MEDKSNDRELGALWIKESKAGMKFMSGKCGDEEIVIFKNTYKEEGSNQPDYRILKSERPEAVDKPKEDTEQPPF